MLRRRISATGSASHRDDPAPPAASLASTYQLRPHLFATDHGYWIEDADRHRTFRIERDSPPRCGALILRDTAGVERFRVGRAPTALCDALAIECPSGAVMTVRRTMVAPLRERFSVDLAGGGSWDVAGSIVDHEYEIDGSRGHVAAISKRWFRTRDSFGVEIAPGEDDALVLLVAVVIDELIQPGH